MLEIISSKFGWLYRNGKPYLEIECPESMRNTLQEFVNGQNGKQYDVTIKEHKEKKSRDANAYCWVLLDKLAVELSKETPRSAEEIYRDLIPDVGGNNTILPIKNEAVEAWIHNWEYEPKTKKGWVCKVIGDSKHEGYTNIINYYGSSTYDQAQMSRLIDLVVRECKAQGIETMTPAELERLKQEWGEKK